MKKKRHEGKEKSIKKKIGNKKIRTKLTYLIPIILISLLTIYLIFSLKFVSLKTPISGKPTDGTVGLTILVSCSQNVISGWNLISLCANSTNKSIQSIMSSMDYRYIMRWNTTTMAYDIYSPRASGNSFIDMNLSEGYFILLYSESTLSVPGENNDNMNISLTTGWNSPTYPYEFTTNISNYVDSIEGNYRYLMKWNRLLQQFDIYSPRASSNPFSTINGGEGQFISCYVQDILEYNRTKCLNG